MAGKQREEALRGAMLREMAERLRREIVAIGEMAALPLAELELILQSEAERQQALRKLPWEQRLARDRSPEARGRSRRHDIAQRVAAPAGRTLGQLLRRLSPEQWALLEQNGEIVFSTAPRPGVLPLPADIAAAFRATPLTFPPRRPLENAAEEESDRRREREARERWEAATGYQVLMRLEGIPGGMRAHQFSMSVRPLSDDESQRYRIFTGPGTFFSLWMEAQELPGEVEADRRQRPEGVEDDALLDARKQLRTESPWRVTPFGPRKDDHWRIQELLPDLARAFGVQFISDAYAASPHFLSVPALTREPVALREVLERPEASAPRWDRRGHLIRLRSRTWFLDRPREVPLRLARRLKALCDRQGAPRWEESVQLATTLSDAQLAGLGDLAQEAGWALAVYPARHALRLYASLAPAQQQALWRGELLPAARLTPVQRALLQAQAKEPNRLRAWWLPRPPGPPDGFALRAGEPRVIRRERRGGITTRYLEADGTPAPPPRAMPPSAAAKGPEDSTVRFRLRTINFSLAHGGEKLEGFSLEVPFEE